jgi:Mg-chelatase subunit ChlD
MTEQKSNSIKMPSGRLRVNVSAPDYHTVERQIQVEQSQRMTIRLYPRRSLQQAASLPSMYDQQPWKPEPAYQLQPTLIVGLGGTGRQVLTHIKKNLLDAGFGQMPARVRLALLDTPTKEQSISFGDVALTPEEIVELSTDLKPLVQQLRRQPDPDLSGWFPAEEYAQRLSDEELNLEYGTRQRRPLSRAMLIQDLRQGIFDEGIDILLLIDCSGSMGDEFQEGDEHLSRLQAAKRSGLIFLSQLDRLADRVGVIAFAREAREIAPLSNDFEQASQAIKSISLGNETNIHDGLEKAIESFSHSSLTKRPRVVILLSDGESDAQTAISSAEKLKQSGAHLVSIGIGKANRDLLEQLASSWQDQADAFYAADAETLGQIYLRLARRMGQGSRVWRLLRSMASSVLDKDSLRVIMVASMAGGFGSAILADIAYLSRRVGQALGAKSISVEAYLADAAVFSRIANVRYEVLQANSFATLREIERFQLAQGFPFRMIYDSHSSNSVLNSTLNWRLLDNLFLFDHLPNLMSRNDGLEERWFDPSSSVFPMMADAICFALDNASRAGTLREYRRNIQGAITSEQWARGRAVAGSIGVFRYLLPMRDVFEIFKARWAISLVSQLLSGQSRPDEIPRAEQNQEESAANLEQHVRLFLLGYAGYENPSCPASLKAVGRVLVEGRELVAEVKAEREWNVDAESQTFNAYLRSAVQVMLNGLSSSSFRVARAGKAGYVLSFLGRLEEDLEDAALLFSSTVLGEVCEIYRNETRQVRNDLQVLLGNLNPLLKQNQQAVDTPALIQKLQEKEEHLLVRLKAQHGILSREILLSEDELAALFKEPLSAVQPFDDALAHIYWVYDDQSRLALTLHAWREVTLMLQNTDIEVFLDELLNMAGQTGKELLEKEAMPSWFQRKAPQLTQKESVSEQTWIGCQPLLRFTPQKAANAQSFLTLALRDKDAFDWLATALSAHMPAEQQFALAQIADPYSLIVAYTLDVVPCDALENWNDHQQVYNRWNGLTDQAERDPYAETTAVFRAESTSLQWEIRLPKMLRQSPRLFSPLVVTALEEDVAARLFALAFASGWVQLRERSLSILPPINSPIQVELPDISNFARHLSPYVMGMVYFGQHATSEQLRSLEEALQSVDLEQWRRWTGPDWQHNDWAKTVLSAGSPDALDFIAYVAMIARTEFLKRSQNRQ